jgi:hypothetical protein
MLNNLSQSARNDGGEVVVYINETVLSNEAAFMKDSTKRILSLIVILLFLLSSAIAVILSLLSK